MTYEPSVARFASLLADPARAHMAMLLLQDRAMPAGDLARSVGISAQLASKHLGLLVEGGVLQVQQRGRHRYFSLADSDIAHALETFTFVGNRSITDKRWESPDMREMRYGRSCYRHLAGVLGVWLLTRLVQANFLAPSGHEFILTAKGTCFFEKLGMDVELIAKSKHVAYCCLDWSERRDHLAGKLASALLDRLLELGWLRKKTGTRIITITREGIKEFTKTLECPPAD